MECHVTESISGARHNGINKEIGCFLRDATQFLKSSQSSVDDNNQKMKFLRVNSSGKVCWKAMRCRSRLCPSIKFFQAIHISLVLLFQSVKMIFNF